MHSIACSGGIMLLPCPIVLVCIQMSVLYQLRLAHRANCNGHRPAVLVGLLAVGL